MGKLLLISVLAATVVLPMRAARHPSPARALRRAVSWVAASYAAYLVGILYVLPRLG
ncbi:hypothetical protein tb265_43950 [Gemmatimonadetes bacterium T265]|nr:hypothetical protein tb265_43950 [Gemmatimonadetes bacterium T265]